MITLLNILNIMNFQTNYLIEIDISILIVHQIKMDQSVMPLARLACPSLLN